MKAGFTGKRAPARRGDKVSNGDKMKAEAFNIVIDQIAEMSPKQLKGFVKSFDQNANVQKMVNESIDYNFNNDFEAVKTAAEGEGLSEQFLDDLKIIFESTVKSKVEDVANSVAVNFDRKLKGRVANVQNGLIEKLDQYIDYFADNYLEENKLAIENGIRTEISESFMNGIHSLFLEHNVAVPDGKENLLESKDNKAKELSEAVRKADQRAKRYHDKAKAFMKEAIISRYKTGLTVKEQHEFERRAMQIESFKDEDDFSQKVGQLKKLYFSESNSFINKDKEEFETLVETVEYNSNGTPMDAYVKTISNMNKKI